MTYRKTLALTVIATLVSINASQARDLQPDPVSGPNYELVQPGTARTQARYVYYETASNQAAPRRQYLDRDDSQAPRVVHRRSGQDQFGRFLGSVVAGFLFGAY